MQKNIIKSGKAEQYFLLMAAVSYLHESGKYEGLLLVQKNGREHARCEASDIRIYSKYKKTVIQQIMKIAEQFPPREDICILDMGVVTNERSSR